jgi:hypothetical protein
MIRILLSFAMIAITLLAVTSATIAYFSNGQVLAGNTFATGTVTLDPAHMAGFPLTFTNLGPGIQQSAPVQIRYRGTLPADIYVGARGTSAPGDPQYLADKLNILIRQNGVGDWYSGLVSGISTGWVKIASNVSQDQLLDYTLYLTLDPATGNDKQGQTNTDTQVLLYAVQTGGTVPTTVPYLTTGNFPWP